MIRYEDSDEEMIAFARSIRTDIRICDTLLVISSTTRHRRAAQELTGTWYDGYLPEPSLPEQLFGAVSETISEARKRGTVKANAPAAEAAEKPASRTDISVLLAEDNPVNRKVQEKLLQRLGCRVDFAGNGLEAIKLASRNSYDVIFMDCQMPEMDGLEATKRIRSHEKSTGLHPLIIALTGHAMSGDRDKCLSVGMDDYLAKPVKASDFKRVLKKWNFISDDGKEKAAKFDNRAPFNRRRALVNRRPRL